jgi:predicted transcriptional regulator
MVANNMLFEDNLNFYEEIKDDLKFYGISGVRMKIMLCLMDGPKKTKQLRKLTGIQSSTILHGISELEKQRIVAREGDNYYLSETGQILTPKLVDMIKTLVVLRNSQNLWINHEISAIPQDLLMEIGSLSDSQLIESESTNIYKTHEKHIQVVRDSKEIKGVSPIFYPIYIETFRELIKKGVKVELILTDEVLKRTIDSHDQGIDDMKKLLSTGNLIIWKIKDVKAAFTVTDKFMTLGLFLPNGKYDSSRILVSDHNDAIEWANKLFEHYRKSADRFEL